MIEAKPGDLVELKDGLRGKLVAVDVIVIATHASPDDCHLAYRSEIAQILTPVPTTGETTMDA